MKDETIRIFVVKKLLLLCVGDDAMMPRQMTSSSTSSKNAYTSSNLKLNYLHWIFGNHRLAARCPDVEAPAGKRYKKILNTAERIGGERYLR